MANRSTKNEAAATAEVPELNVLSSEDKELEECAEKLERLAEENMTFAVKRQDDTPKGPRVRVFIPKAEPGENGMKTDEYEHVTIANEKGEKNIRIRRGIWTDIPVEAFIILKQGRYPDL